MRSDSSLTGLGMKPTSDPSLTSLPIHQSLSYFSCVHRTTKHTYKELFFFREKAAGGTFPFVQESHTFFFLDRQVNCYTLICKKSRTLNETALPCTGESSSMVPSYATLVLTANATGLLCIQQQIWKRHLVTFTFENATVGKLQCCKEIMHNCFFFSIFKFLNSKIVVALCTLCTRALSSCARARRSVSLRRASRSSSSDKSDEGCE